METAKIEQIRIHGRGGQGVVSAAEIIALAASYSGYEVQAFPSFGVERTGAPIQAFVRISSGKILTREQVYEPTILIIQDASLLEDVDVFRGSTRNTLVIINSPEDRWPELHRRFKRFYTAPATEIAMEIFGKNIVNTVILGSFAHYSGLADLEGMKKAIAIKFKSKGQAVIDKNIEAISRAYAGEQARINKESL